MSRPYGYKKPRVPHHTLRLHAHVAGEIDLPPVVDLIPNCPPILDQGQIGSCTGCSGVGGAGLLSRRQIRDGVWHGEPLIASALGLYYCEREIDGTIGDDAGSSIADSVMAMRERGLIPETDWPYDEKRLTDTPPATALADAAHCRLVDAAPIGNDILTIRTCLAMGYPIQIGVTVFESFESADNGDVPLPETYSERQLGGHAILLVGYNDNDGRVVFRNSWGTSWGRSGYGSLPYEYLEDLELCSELFVLRRLEQHPASTNPLDSFEGEITKRMR